MSSLAIPKRKKVNPAVALAAARRPVSSGTGHGVSDASISTGSGSSPASGGIQIKAEPGTIPANGAGGGERKKWTSYTLRAGDVTDDRFNVMRIASRRQIDPAKDLVKPIKLARRDLHEVPESADAATAADTDEVMAEVETPAAPPVAPSVAPYGGPVKKRGFNKRTRQIYRVNENTARLRIEERLPWILEDFDGQSLEGHLEGGQAGGYVFLQYSPDGFTVTPVSKFFKFQHRASYQTLSIDEAEERMGKSKALPRWFMKNHRGDEGANGPGLASMPQHRMRTTNAGPGSRQSRQHSVKKEEMEEELDFEEDFADDEEQHGLVENEEDNKELEERIKREMLSANALGDAEPGAESEDEETKRQLDKEGRRLQRYLEKLEKNNMYQNDSDSDPYKSSSDSESESKADSAVNKDTNADGNADDKSAEKKRDDSIRDRVNRLQNTSVTTYNTPQAEQGQYDGTPQPPPSSSGHATPSKHRREREHALVTLKIPRYILARFPGIPASSVDGQLRKRRNGSVESDRDPKKLRFGGTPAGSRGASPSARGSRASTPTTASSTGGVTTQADLITPDELREIILSNAGLTMRGLLKILKPRLVHAQNKAMLGNLLRQIGTQTQNGVLTIKGVGGTGSGGAPVGTPVGTPRPE
ncbi:transcription factor IIF subunit tfg1 [Savitreella phatthalungensis]